MDNCSNFESKHDLVKFAYEMRFAEDLYVRNIAYNDSYEENIITVNHYAFDHTKKIYNGLDYFECAIISNHPWFINAFETRYGAIKKDFKEEWKQAQKSINESTNLNYLAFFGKSERFEKVCNVSSSEISKMDKFKQWPISNALHNSMDMAFFVYKLGGRRPLKAGDSECISSSYREPISGKWVSIDYLYLSENEMKRKKISVHTNTIENNIF